MFKRKAHSQVHNKYSVSSHYGPGLLEMSENRSENESLLQPPPQPPPPSSSSSSLSPPKATTTKTKTKTKPSKTDRTMMTLRHRLKMKMRPSPKFKAVMHMSLCMAVHFSGHEFARGPTTSMFTSKEIGFSSAAALPLGIGFVSPFTLLVLWIFSKMLNNYGPRYALVRSTLAGASFLTFIGLSLQLLKQQEGDDRIMLLEGIDLTIFSRTLLFALFVFQSANVQFLYTQHWSFLGSILTPEEGKVWFAPIAGIGSITSTIAASQVSHLVEKIGLIGLLCTAALVIGSSAIFADAAYKVATEHGFEPTHDAKKKQEKNVKADEKQIEEEDGLIKSTQILFKRVPILRAMFFEVILQQLLSSLLNFQFMLKVKDTIINDELRAGWTGSCYAWINGISGAMQFFILPTVTRNIDPAYLWISMPTVMLFLTGLQLFGKDYNPSLNLVACTFLSMKIIEYSIRGQVTEMIFASLDYESRFVGKQKIGLLANRLGKSTMAISLFLLAMYFEKDVNHIIVVGAAVAASLWLLATIQLTQFIEKPISNSSPKSSKKTMVTSTAVHVQ